MNSTFYITNSSLMEKVSQQWSKTCAKYQVELIRDYVEKHGRENTGEWINYLAEEFNLHKRNPDFNFLAPKHQIKFHVNHAKENVVL